MLNCAIQDNLLPNNPCNRFIKLKTIERRPKYIYTKEELLKVLHQVDKTQFAMPVLLESLCRLHHEEFCGLDREDIIFQDDKWIIIHINKAVTCAGKKKVLKDPKTRTSTRKVLLHPVFSII